MFVMDCREWTFCSADVINEQGSLRKIVLENWGETQEIVIDCNNEKRCCFWTE